MARAAQEAGRRAGSVPLPGGGASPVNDGEGGSPAVTEVREIREAINLHPYHYSANNPVKFTDPDGETP